ncbi:MAG: malonyl-[acyl-carrier protein] O-methyltransferase BioC, partial [Gammaproteobacteria bacterium HGW-Gammaproteobacteria-12]
TSLKDLGAHNLNPGRPGGLTGRSRIRALIEAYECFRQPQGLPATYQVLYGVLQKPSQA